MAKEPVKYLWEILVPAAPFKGKTEIKITHDHHKKWDEYVMSLSDGLTVLRAGRGEWISPEGVTHNDRMIPCRVYCDTNTIYKIIDFTLKHYKQEAIMSYKLSDCVIMRYNNNGQN